MEKNGINQALLWKEQMWRGRVRGSRKFKQSLRRLIEEMS